MSKWPKTIPLLTEEQQRIRDDFMKYWHTVLPKKYRLIERFNHGYPAQRPTPKGCKTLEIGAGLGEHLKYEEYEKQHYVALELRKNMVEEIAQRFPQVQTLLGDCQQHIPCESEFFDYVLAIHVLEHLPDLPSALGEIYRVLKQTGLFIAVIPCEGGWLYSLARNISARRIFEKRYHQSYDWLIQSEHINKPDEIIEQCKNLFGITERKYFPLFFPSIKLNLCIGITMQKKLISEK